MEFNALVKNWWSKAFLVALLGRANERDLELGFKYLKRNNVIELRFNDNRVISVVLGPNGGRHNNYIVFPKFSIENTALFLDILKHQPAELLSIANNALNPSIELILSKCNLHLFAKFEDVCMECNCKDNAPCRYLIATILKLGTLIDKDPSILFKLRCCNVNDVKETPILNIDAFVPYERGLFRTKENVTESTSLETFVLPEFKFLKWTDYSQILPSLLPSFPKFCKAGNFKKSYSDEMNRIHDYFCNFKTFESFTEYFRIYGAKTHIDASRPLWLEHLPNWNWQFHLTSMRFARSNSSLDNVPNTLSALCILDESSKDSWDISVQFAHYALKIAFYLVRTGSIYPQVFWLDAHTAQIRWLPAEMLPETLSTIVTLENAMPVSMVQSEGKFLFEKAEHLLSQYIGALLKFARTVYYVRKNVHENLLGFFFDCKSGKLNDSALNIPQEIQTWLSVYDTLDFKTEIIFRCTEDENYIALHVFVKTGEDITSLKSLFESKDSRLLSVLNILSCVAEHFNGIRNYIEDNAQNPIYLEGRSLFDFLFNAVEKIKVLGIRVELPKSLLNIKKPQVRISIRSANPLKKFTANDILDFDFEIAIGDETISATEFLELSKNADGLLKFRSQYVELSAKDIEELKVKTEKRTIDRSKLVQACLSGEYRDDYLNENNAFPVTLTPEIKAGMEAFKNETEVLLPKSLQATLRPYQKRGFFWLYKNLELGFGCILADDMGLGKTLQVITYLLKLKEEERLQKSKALIVVPAGLLCNWQVEIRKFAPLLSVFSYHGYGRCLKIFKEDILITTYGTLRRDITKLQELPWQIVIMDEAQNIKNLDSEQSKIARSLKAPMKIAMSGTPVENRLMEFYALMDFCNRGLFSTQTEFRERFEMPIQKFGDTHAAELFKKITAPFMLRRLKTDKTIIDDLPEKIVQDEYAELTKTQAILYQKTLDSFLKELEGIKTEESSSKTLFKRKGLILQMILALKQICNHPKTFLKGDFLPVEHSLSKDSGKARMLMDLTASILEQGEKALVFTQFSETGSLLQQMFEEELHIKVPFYHGGLSQQARNNMVEDFQNNDSTRMFILSLKAGGTGLNLTAASQVIHYDLWWNPAIEAQASDRAYRIGQKKNVQVHRFVTKGTFEEKINALLESKRSVADMTVNAGETWLCELSDKELGEIFGLENNKL